MIALSSVPSPFMALRRSSHRFSLSNLGSGTMEPCPSCSGEEKVSHQKETWGSGEEEAHSCSHGARRSDTQERGRQEHKQ